MAPKLKPGNKKATKDPALNYGTIQTEEIEALKAIYMYDFESVEVKSAWSTTTDRSFKLKLRAFSDEETFVILSVRLTATYPKSAPLLEVSGHERYHERTQKRIRSIVTTWPNKHLGEEMIHAIASEIQDALEDAVLAREQGTLPSLEDERANAKEAAAETAKQAEEAELLKQQEVKEEQDRLLKQLVEAEVNRRERLKPATATKELKVSDDGAESTVVTFDQPATMQITSDTLRFNEVAVLDLMHSSRDQQTKTFLAKPIVHSAATTPLIVVKRICFQKSRDEIIELERSLATVVDLRHHGLLNLLTYRIDKIGDLRSELISCHEYANRGTLQDVIELGLSTNKARQFTIELLEALDYLHNHGVTHGRITSRSVLLVSGPPMSPKLSEFGYAWPLQNQRDNKPSWPIPGSAVTSVAGLRKSDIWQFGSVVAQMFLGNDVVTKYNSPQLMLDRLDLTDVFEDFLRKIFTVDAKKRPSAFDLLPSEFLRTDGAALESTNLLASHIEPSSSTTTSSSYANRAKRRSRHNSSSLLDSVSRYANDFTEISRLGKGGFGEVVKARNKLDGGVYAIKKIKQAPQLLDQVISEVMLLNRLNHPYVVRYFSAWIEEESSNIVIEDSTTETETATGGVTDTDTSDLFEFGYQSRGGLDFVSSSGLAQIEFGDDSDEESSDGDADKASPIVAVQSVHGKTRKINGSDLRQSKSFTRKGPSTLYIQMEYCERHTLRDLIRKAMTMDDSWRYVRQITEGLAHIHGHGIIHRDLKPDNVFIDLTGNPKIGDFGLATTAQQHYVERAATMSGYSAGEMTRSVGTTLYVAPELRSASGTSYNDKVDMFSLGIIFYEMCEPFKTGMERINALQRLREKDHELPRVYHAHGEKAAQGKIISCLISHKPSERPSSTELLRGDMLPVKVEDETIRKALTGLSDPKSPYHQKIMSALFAHDSANNSRVKALAWDARSSRVPEDAKRLRLRNIALHNLQSVFRRHGAEESRRQNVFPKSDYYTNANLFQILDASGNLLQLPYDLVLPHARQVARHQSEVRCTYSVGGAYRDAFDSGPPKVSEEVDFDVTDSGNSEDIARNDAEVVKVMDEIVSEMPLFSSYETTSFHLNHAHILDTILQFCRVPFAQHLAIKEILSRLGFHQHTWSKVRVELRKFGLPDSTLDDLEQFDFRDAPEKALTRVETIIAAGNATLLKRFTSASRHLIEVVRILAHLAPKQKIYVAPLGSVNAKFYEDGVLFQCVLERKSNRVVIAAGGRYDSLIRAHRSVDARTKPQGAVGVSIGLDPIISNMVKNSDNLSKKAYLKHQSESTAKRCNVLVSATGTDAVQNAGMRLLASLWENGLGAELATTQTSRNEDHNFVVTLRHEASNTVKVLNTESGSEEVEVALPALISHLQQELREQDNSRHRVPSLLRQTSHPDGERRSNVQVLMASRGSKKSNKYQIVADAQEQWAGKLEEAKNAPILAIEGRDDALDLIQQTRLSDAESWRKAVQSVPLNDRQYMQQIQEMLASWRKKWEEGGSREASVFNFRTQRCIYYDLGL